MLVLCGIRAGTVEPIALLDIAQTGKLVAHNPQDIRIERAIGWTMDCPATGWGRLRLHCRTRQQRREDFQRVVAIMQLDDPAEYIVTILLGVMTARNAQRIHHAERIPTGSSLKSA